MSEPDETPAHPAASPEIAPEIAPGTAPTARLWDQPDWVYLLREFDALYRGGSAGGSKAIRSHRRRVRTAVAAVLEDDPEVVDRETSVLPVTAYLERAVDVGERGAAQPLARAFGRVAGRLTWEYGYERLPRPLARKYGFCDVVGPRGPVKTDRLILGFVLLAPRTTYPQHSHEGIEESYVSVAGAWSENDSAVYAPGSLILNRAEHEHRITTGDMEPCLLAYAWVGPPERLAAPDMKLTARRTARGDRRG